MPELPDIVVYIEALEQRILDQTLERVFVASPFLLRTAVPPINSLERKKVVRLRRLGKRICFGFEGDLWLVLHLMIAGRLHWKDSGPKSGAVSRASGKASPKGRNQLAAFHFTNGTLSLTEAGSKRRASLHLVEGAAGLRRLDPGGREIFETDLEGFARVLTSANHTLKRALTDPRLFSGIGNAYSDEILFDARLSPVKLTQRLTPEEIERLFISTRTTLTKWIEVLRADAAPVGNLRSGTGVPPVSRKRGSGLRVRTGSGSDRVPVTANKTIIPFPEKVTAFRPRWPSTGSTANRALAVGARYSASVTRQTKLTIVRIVRLVESSSPIERSRDCCAPTGPGVSKNWKALNDAELLTRLHDEVRSALQNKGLRDLQKLLKK